MKIIIIFIMISIVFICYLQHCNEKYKTVVFDDDFEYVTKTSDGTSIKLLKDHQWSSDFKRRFMNHEVNSNLKLKELMDKIPPNTHIIDVGGHVGDTGLYLALILQKHHYKKNINVIIIEPDKSKINFIKEMVIVNKLNNVVLIESGISDKYGVGYLNHNYRNPGATTIKYGKGNIKIDTVDNLCSKYNVSLMHIDVEGMELECLKGSKHTLQNTKYVMIELNKIKERSEEIKFLINHGFFKHDDPSIFKENGNVLFYKL
jgi:FkbM family methyltransferase